MSKKTSFTLYLRTVLDQFHDPQFTLTTCLSLIAILIAIGGVLVSLMTTRKFKALQVVILASTSMVEVKNDIVNDITIFYKGEPIHNLSLYQVKVENTGNLPIHVEDFTEPIKFVFPDRAKIIEAAVLESSPPNIGMTVAVEQNIASLSKVLLNANDRVIVRFLVTDMPANGNIHPFTVGARITELMGISVVNAIEEEDIAGLKLKKDILNYSLITLGVLLGIGILLWLTMGWISIATRFRYSTRSEEELKKALREVVAELQNSKRTEEELKKAFEDVVADLQKLEQKKVQKPKKTKDKRG